MRPSSSLISPSELRSLMPDVSVLDVRFRLGGPPGHDEFLRGHIPGASYVDLETALADPQGDRGRHPLPEGDRFTPAMRRAGVSTGRAVVVYDDVSGTSAARCWWLLRYFGHDRVRLLDGGLTRWRNEDGPIEEGESDVRPGDFDGRPGHLPVLDADAAARLARQGRLVDARAPERFRGEQEPVDPVAGHIPGAVNVPTAANLTGAPPDGRFQSLDVLRASYERAGVREGTEVGVYCGSGVTAAHDVLALDLLGIRAALYPGSWSEWVTDPARPIEPGA